MILFAFIITAVKFQVKLMSSIFLEQPMEKPITALQTPDCDWLRHRLIEVNFSKLTASNKIFRNEFVCLHYRLCKISA